MKKGWKLFWIISASIGGIGLILCCISLALGVSYEEVLEHYPNGIGWVSASDEEQINQEQDKTIPEQYTKKYELTEYPIEELEIEIGAGELDIRPYDGTAIIVNTGSSNHTKTSVTDNILLIENHVKKLNSSHHIKKSIIYIPKQVRLISTDISAGAGEINIEGLCTEELVVSCKTGDVTITGGIIQDIGIESTVGDITVNFNGKETDYNYDLSCGIGDLKVNGQEWSGIRPDFQMDNNAAKEMMIECGIGDVAVSFQEN
ncbi:MAG: DUF4097 family beta strand repeat-containing protein [Lachnospiraceae bacterium]